MKFLIFLIFFYSKYTLLFAKSDKNKTVIEADNIISESKNSKISASGNVIFIRDKYKITADKVIYDKNKKKIYLEKRAKFIQIAELVLSPALHKFMILSSDIKLRDNILISAFVFCLQIIQQVTTTGNFFHQAQARVIIFGMNLKMLNQVVNLGRPNSNLHFRRTCIIGVKPISLN